MTTYISKETQTNVEEQSNDLTKEQAKEQAKEQDEEGPTCGICYIALNNKNTVITTCSHAYCTSCFFKWLDRKETCALCRKVLLSDRVVEERLNTLQDVQEELMDNYRCLRVLKRNIKKKRCKKNNLSDDINSLLNRQIRMRYLLQQTRSVCRETLTRSRFLKKAVEMQKESLELMKNYRSEWDELHTPLLVPTEEEGSEEEFEEWLDDDVVNMTAAIDNMIILERRRTITALQRMQEAERFAEEVIEVENSEDDINEEEDAEEERIAMGFSDAEDTEDAEEDAEEERIAMGFSDAEDAEDAEDTEEEIEVDLTVFGTSIPTLDFRTPPRRTVRVPAERNHRQSPMFVFGQQSNSITNAFQIPTLFTPIGSREELQASPSTVPPVLEIQREENSWPLNPGHAAMNRLFDSRTDNEEKTGE